jgi:hypothetical protein
MDAMDFLKRYVDVIHPYRFRPAIATEAKKDDAKLTFLHVLFISALNILAVVISVSLSLKMVDEIFSEPGVAVPQDLPALREQMLQSVAPLPLVLNFLIIIAAFYAFGCLLFLFCRALGGKGRLGSQLYAGSVVMVSGMCISFVLLVLSPLLSCISGLLFIVLLLYMLLLGYTVVRAVHPGLDQWRAGAAIALLVIVLLAVLFVLGKVSGQ